MSRYEKLFAELAERGEGAFVPFIMLSDPTPEVALEVVRAAIAGGADSLELGVPFSDPVADGPTIQASHVRALANGATVDAAVEQVRTIRAEFPDIPISMLIYGNVAFSRGLETFYQDFADAGADAILLPDVPVRESGEFIEAASRAGIEPVFLAPAQASEETLRGVAGAARGYIYAVSRDGVTGTELESETTGFDEVVRKIEMFDGVPALLGFGLSTPTHVANAMAAGAAGAITGSALTKVINEHLDDQGRAGEGLAEAVREFVASMKAATLPATK
ncbi:MAG: tryptophan synthase subunit alpha [Actinomycetaceae bacterium]|nr:tryptophan synthase subunit alpha [Actinomycetaceae bacterium]